MRSTAPRFDSDESISSPSSPPVSWPLPPSPNDPSPEYPPGPFGNQIGQTLQDFTMHAYRLSPKETDSKKLAWDDEISMREAHDSKACKCLVVSVAAMWCGECARAADDREGRRRR